MKQNNDLRFLNISLFVVGFFALLLIGYALYLNMFYEPAWKEESREIEVYSGGGVVVTPQIEETQTFKAINQEVIKEAKKYFWGVDFEGFKIEYGDYSVWDSKYNDGKRTIYIGVSDIQNNPEMYKMVFTHEYIHYLLHRFGLEGKVEQESLADTYTWFLNKQINTELWGVFNSGRSFPYDIIMDEILKENKFNCLEKVFSEEKKIKLLDTLIIRLENRCKINMAYGDFYNV